MKATEYATIFDNDPTTETLRKISFDFLMEIKGLSEARHAQTDAAMLAIFMEQDRKWVAFANRAGGGAVIRSDGFRVLTMVEFPFVADALGWKS